MQIYRKQYPPVSRAQLILVTRMTGWDTREYVFRLVDNGEVIDTMSALDVYERCPTHKTFKEFIDRWLSEQDMPYESTLSLGGGFKQHKPNKRYSKEDGS